MDLSFLTNIVSTLGGVAGKADSAGFINLKKMFTLPGSSPIDYEANKQGFMAQLQKHANELSEFGKEAWGDNFDQVPVVQEVFKKLSDFYMATKDAPLGNSDYDSQWRPYELAFESAKSKFYKAYSKQIEENKTANISNTGDNPVSEQYKNTVDVNDYYSNKNGTPKTDDSSNKNGTPKTDDSSNNVGTTSSGNQNNDIFGLDPLVLAGAVVIGAILIFKK